MTDVGRPIRVIEAEPVTDPVPREQPVEAPAEPAPSAPVEVPELVPA